MSQSEKRSGFDGRYKMELKYAKGTEKGMVAKADENIIWLATEQGAHNLGSYYSAMKAGHGV